MFPNTKADALSTSAVGVLHNKLVSKCRVEVLPVGSRSCFPQEFACWMSGVAMV
jgi:hypothetical protein